MRTKRFVIGTLVVMMVVGLGIAFADKPADKGNKAPSGKHYNLNIIGVNNEKNDNFDGGNGSRIFVLRDGATWFYVGASDHYEVLDHDATDGVCGNHTTNPADEDTPPTTKGVPGILFPYAGGQWRVQIYVRLLGPKTSQVKWRSYYWDGGEYIKFYEDVWSKDTKFRLRTNDLLADGFEDILWEMLDKEKFRLLQMRIYLEPVE